jgi:dihydrofolate reductase
MSVTLILAAAQNGVIGRDGAIPWHISDDLKRFKALTMGNTIVMGRKTWDSLPKKPLPGRRNIVVTRDSEWRAEGAESMSLDAALALPDVFVIGGAEIYRGALARADRIELTEIHKSFDGDARFDFDREDWRETARQGHVTPEGLRYSYVTLEHERRHNPARLKKPTR